LKNNEKGTGICKKGRRNQAEYKRESSKEFKDGQRFRAGCEGIISVLKRVFNLGLCLFKGFKNYAAGVGCAVFCHNLTLLTRLYGRSGQNRLFLKESLEMVCSES